MKYDNLRAFEKALSESSSAKLKSLYLIIGKDFFEQQEATDLLLRSLLPSAEMRELGLLLLSGSQLEEKDLREALAPSFFVKTSVIWIQEAEKLKKSLLESLEKSFFNLSSSQFFIFTANQWQKNSSFYKFIEKEGILLDIAELKPWEKEKRLIEWIGKQAAASLKLIAYPVCQLLLKRVGCDQALLDQEIKKLICYCADKKEISVQDVEILCSQEHVDSIWQLGEALFQRETASALQKAYVFLEEGQALLPIVRQLRSQFQTHFQISLLLFQGKKGEEITQEFPYLKGQILERHLQLAKHYGLHAFKQGLLILDETESKLKNGLVDEKILVETLIIKLTKRPIYYE